MLGFSRNKRQPELSDKEVIEGLQQNDVSVERSFYLSCQRYFKDRRSGVFDFKGIAQNEEDLFQDSFVKLWQEIQARHIYVRDNYAWRFDKSGQGRKMTASLKTYLMAIAKYRNLEIIREEVIYGSLDSDLPETPDVADEEEEVKLREWIVQQCVNNLPPRCKEILTLFYFDGKTLDEILAIRKENKSKDGLKTGKSKCMKTLTDNIIKEFERHHLKP